MLDNNLTNPLCALALYESWQWEARQHHGRRPARATLAAVLVRHLATAIAGALGRC